MKRLAFLGFPHLGGTYTVFRNLQRGLSSAGVEVRWVSGAADAHRGSGSAFFRTQRHLGSLIGSPGDTDVEQAQALLTAIREERYEGVFVNVLADRVQTNIARYLPPDIVRIMIVHNITPGTYAAAAALRSSVHSVVGVSQRICDDLVEQYRFDPAQIRLIPNGVDTHQLARPRLGRPRDGVPRLLYLGRIEDQSKGVFWLPDILERVIPQARLTVAGDGPSLAGLKARFEPLGSRVDFLGSVSPEDTPDLFASHDILIMPSRFEGFPLALMEAMASGCVPVASHLAGVTDMAIKNGQNGYLFPVGDAKMAARAINALCADRALLRSMSMRAMHTVVQHFGLDQMARDYRQLIEDASARQTRITPPLPLSKWHYPVGLGSSLRAYVPVPIKNALRRMREVAITHRTMGQTGTRRSLL